MYGRVACGAFEVRERRRAASARLSVPIILHHWKRLSQLVNTLERRRMYADEKRWNWYKC
jgi:hypothetical protein